MELIIYENIPCPILLKKEPDIFLVLFKCEQKWIFRCSLGYGEIKKDAIGKYYIFNRKFHREDGPAKDYYNGDKVWYQNGQYHRLDGPAKDYCDGEKHWFKNGQYHRLDGPAIECDFEKRWYIEGKKYSEKEYNKKIEQMKQKDKNE